MKMKPNVNVTYRKDQKEWAVISDNAQRAAGLFGNKTEATKAGREIAINRGVELVIRGMNGRIQDKDSYGKDTCPPKDKVH